MAKQPLITSSSDALRLLAEKMLAQSKVPNIYGYSPMDKQKIFHAMKNKRRLYIGGNRSGKTTGGVVEDLWWATGEHPFRTIPEPPIRGRIVGVDFLNGIQKIILPEVARWVPVSKLRGHSWSTAYDKLDRVLHFENGSFIEFMSYDQDLDKFAGTSRHFIHFDEEPPESIYDECRARLVDTNGDLWLTMTPVEGMTWVYDNLYLPGVELENNGPVGVVEVSMDENTYLSSVAIEEFLDSLTEDERKIRGEGKFVQLGGLVYKEFSSDVHVINPPDYSTMYDWTWAASVDHGYNNPTAWLWHAVSPEGEVITFKEYYKSGETIDYHANQVRQVNEELRKAPDFYIGDPSIRNTDPITGTSIQEEYLKYGIPIILGNNDVKAGIVKVARHLKVNQKTKRPLYVVSSECENLIREFTRYRWKTFANKRLNDQTNAQERPVQKDDHALDSLRYFIMSRPDLTPDLPGTKDKINNPLGLGYANGESLVASTTGEPSFIDGFVNRDYNTDWNYDEHLGGMV